MMFLKTKNYLVPYFLLLVLIFLSTSSFFLIWGVLFLMMFLFILSFNTPENKITFFLIQEISTFLLIFSFFFFMPKLLIFISLLLKMANPPFHFWVMKMLSSMKSSEFILFLSLIKVVPFYIFSSFLSKEVMIYIVFLMFISNWYMLYTWGLKEIFVFSSSINFFWFCFLFFFSLKFFLLTMIFYFFILWSGVSSKYDQKSMTTLSIVFITLMGVPPMFIFFSKWIVVMFSANEMVNIFIMLSVVLSTYSYYRLFSSLFSGKPSFGTKYIYSIFFLFLILIFF